jgi:hypothetical protein
MVLLPLFVWLSDVRVELPRFESWFSEVEVQD